MENPAQDAYIPYILGLLLCSFGSRPGAYQPELLRAYLRVRWTYRPIVPIWFPGKAARTVREGAILAPDQAVGRLTWEEFLAEPETSKGSQNSFGHGATFWFTLPLNGPSAEGEHTGERGGS